MDISADTKWCSTKTGIYNFYNTIHCSLTLRLLLLISNCKISYHNYWTWLSVINVDLWEKCSMIHTACSEKLLFYIKNRRNYYTSYPQSAGLLIIIAEEAQLVFWITEEPRLWINKRNTKFCILNILSYFYFVPFIFVLITHKNRRLDWLEDRKWRW